MGMVLGVSAGIANILLDYIFMVPLHMGIKGAAFGTGIGYMIPAVIGLWFFFAKRGSLHFRNPVIDFSMGVAPVISYNYGKQDKKQLKNVFCICMRFIMFVSISAFAVALIFGSPLVSIFAESRYHTE